MKKIALKINDGKNNALLISERRKGETEMDHLERIADRVKRIVYEGKMNYRKIEIEMFKVRN